MKLRNKKTGEVVERTKIATLRYVEGDGEWIDEEFQTLAALNEEWEDYAPAEPLIKDEKVRKAVKVWAEANNVLEVFAGRVGDGTYMTLLELYDEDDERRRISVPSAFSPAGMKAGEAYTIAELCGEEEE